jgi:hypothetical protein
MNWQFQEHLFLNIPHNNDLKHLTSRHTALPHTAEIAPHNHKFSALTNNIPVLPFINGQSYEHKMNTCPYKTLNPPTFFLIQLPNFLKTSLSILLTVQHNFFTVLPSHSYGTLNSLPNFLQSCFLSKVDFHVHEMVVGSDVISGSDSGVGLDMGLEVGSDIGSGMGADIGSGMVSDVGSNVGSDVDSGSSSSLRDSGIDMGIDLLVLSTSSSPSSSLSYAEQRELIVSARR